MKFVLLVEGETEQAGLSRFLGRCLEPNFDPNHQVGFTASTRKGWSRLYEDAPEFVRLALTGRDSAEIIAVVSIIDLYGPTFYPADKPLARDKIDWGRKHTTDRVAQHLRDRGSTELIDKYRHFFAVHETEAWFLSQPPLFLDTDIRQAVTKKKTPESVNFDLPPAKFLDSEYMRVHKKHYNKPVNGARFFAALDPATVCRKCPYFKAMINELRGLAEQAGVRPRAE